MHDRAARLSENGRKSRRQHDAIESKTEILSRLRQAVGQRVDAKFRYCQIGRDVETTRRFFGKADRGQATRPQAKHALIIMIFRGFLGSPAFAVRRKNGKPASRARKERVVGDGCRGRHLLNEREHTTKRQLILQNRSLRFCNLASSRLVGATTNLQDLAKISLTRIATSADLRSLRRSI